MIDYFEKIKDAINTIDEFAMENILKNISRVEEDVCPTLFFGNGGSAAIANHAVTDLTKGSYEDDQVFSSPAISLCDNSSLITAISNDIGYSDVFARQIRYLNLPNADVIAISSSGKSPNIINGLMTARELGYYTVALVGFDGGLILKDELADDIIHVKSDNYGIIEDCHMMILHAIIQEMRKRISKNPDDLRL